MLSGYCQAAPKRGFMMTRRVAVVPLLPLLFMGSACTITIGPYDDTGGTAPQETSVLPAPKGGPVNGPPLDEAQQAFRCR